MSTGPAPGPPPTQESAGRPAVGVLRESAPGERRVALTPDGVKRLTALQLDVLVQVGAGAGAWFPDASYAAAGATVTDAPTVVGRCDILLCVNAPGEAVRAAMHPGQGLIGLLQPLTDPVMVLEFADAKTTAISLDGIPRTLSSAQSMDALTSQANVAGYKAALLAAGTYGGYFPMLMTAAGTIRPARVLVMGAGVAGLQAIGTSRRLGAIVTGYDVRDAARADVASTGAAFLDLGASSSAVSVEAVGGYARQLTEQEKAAQQEAVGRVVSAFDVVITTAQVPGRRPPVLVAADAIARMRAGSVVVDLAAGVLGGNVAGSLPDATVVTANGVTVIGAGNLPSTVPTAASSALSRNMSALLAHLMRDGQLHLDTSDPITAGVLVTRDGHIEPPYLPPASTGQGT